VGCGYHLIQFSRAFIFRDKRRNNPGIYKKAAGRRKGRPKAIVERQQRMTLSGVVVS